MGPCQYTCSSHHGQIGDGDEVEPVIEGLLVVFGELDAAGLHFDEAAARPDEGGDPQPVRLLACQSPAL